MDPAQNDRQSTALSHANNPTSRQSDELQMPRIGKSHSPRLGRLERHDLRSVWPSEPLGFTPWLARPENIALLGETLGMRLELEAKEAPVGPFRADILCRDVETEHRVLIENQLERSNHVHLGQILTYASGLDAVTIVWIAATFTEEHQAVLDWLNRLTTDQVRFFGLEVELWRIDGSLAAPKFNVVAKPNQWSQSVAQAARAIDTAELSDIRALQQNYWTAFLEILNRAGGPLSADRKPPAQAYMNFPVGHRHIRLNVAMIRPTSQIRVAFNLCGVNAKLYYRLLLAQKSKIEQGFGYPLQWHEMPDGQESRIAYYLDGVDIEDRSDWPRQQQWLVDHALAFYRVMAPLVGQLDYDGEKAEVA